MCKHKKKLKIHFVFVRKKTMNTNFCIHSIPQNDVFPPNIFSNLFNIIFPIIQLSEIYLSYRKNLKLKHDQF